MVVLSVGWVQAKGRKLQTPKAHLQVAKTFVKRFKNNHMIVMEDSNLQYGLPMDILQIDDSTVNYVSPTIVSAPFAFDICFNTTVDSPDLEYMDRFDIDLPDNWVVTEVYTTTPTGCVTTSIAGVENNQLVYWQIDGSIPSGCGAWNNGTYDFCAAVNVPDCSGAPWSFPWNIVGDGFGDPSHGVSGTTDPVSCQTAELSITPPALYLEGCHTLVHTLTLNLANSTGMDGTFNLAYNVSSGNGNLTGPDQIYLGNGVDQDFIVELSPNACLSDGEQVIAAVAASGLGFQDTSVITKTIRDWEICPDCILEISPSSIITEGCHTSVQSHTLNLANDTGLDGIFDIAYSVSSANANLTGPDQIYLGDGVDQDFIVELTPNACLSDGEQVVGIVEASGFGAQAVAVINHTIRHWSQCSSCNFLPLTIRINP